MTSLSASSRFCCKARECTRPPTSCFNRSGDRSFPCQATRASRPRGRCTIPTRDRASTKTCRLPSPGVLPGEAGSYPSHRADIEGTVLETNSNLLTVAGSRLIECPSRITAWTTLKVGELHDGHGRSRNAANRGLSHSGTTYRWEAEALARCPSSPGCCFRQAQADMIQPNRANSHAQPTTHAHDGTTNR